MKRAFQVVGEGDLSGEVMLLLDDISSSGATFGEAGRAVRKKRPKTIIGLAFASGATVAEER